MKTAVIYTRVSSDRQVENMSLEQQKKICEAWCANNELVVDSIYTDEGKSAKTVVTREEFKKMLEYCRKNQKRIDAVVVYKLDRFARSVQDHAAVTAILRKMGIALLSATEVISDTTTGKLMEHMLASFAEFDNSVRSERSSGGMRARAMDGCWVAGAPIGYVNYRDEAKRPTLRFADKETVSQVVHFFEEFATGKYRQAHAVALAEKVGLRTANGKPLCKNSVIKMLHNHAYYGFIKSKLTDNKPVKAIHPPIITRELFMTVQAVLAGKKRNVAPEKRRNGTFPLRRYLKCGLCEHPLTASVSKGRNGSYPAYHCSKCTKKAVGATVRISQEQAHADFERLLNLVQPARWISKAFREIVLRRWNYEFREVQDQRRRVDRELTELEDRKNKLIDKFVDDKIAEDIYHQQEERIMLQRLELEEERSKLKITEQNKESIVDEAVRFISATQQLWSGSPLEDRQRFQKMVFKHGIFVNPDQTFRTTELSPIFEAITDIENFFLQNEITERSKKSLWYTRRDSNPRPLVPETNALSS
jgi:site-specific DNA recombinase